MATQDPISELIEWIHQYFSTPFVLTPDHFDFLQSTFGTHNLSDLLEQTMDCELESFLALLCYPDQLIHSHYEAHWGGNRFLKDDLDHILDHFTRHPATISIEHPPSLPAAAVTVELPSHIVHAFVHQLKIDRTIPPLLDECLSTLGPLSSQPVFRSLVRHAPIAWQPNQIALVQRFIINMGPHGDTLTPLFKEMVILLAEMASDQDGESFLLSKKAQYRHSLSRANDFERRRQHQAMEILMSQGVRASFGSVVHWQRRLALIDRLFHHLFGRLPVLDVPEDYCFEPDK